MIKPQHREVRGDERASMTAPHVDAGPIALLPEGDDFFQDAIERGGGVVAGLTKETRGLLWLSYPRAAELEAVLAESPQITWVQLPYAGVDAFAGTLQRHGGTERVFTSAKGAFAQPVAEHALAMTLALLRAFPRRARLTTWDREVIGTSLYGLEVTIIGAGGIARELVRLLAPFGVNVTVVRRLAQRVPGAARTVTVDRLNESLVSADVVVIAAAHTDETRHMLSATEFELMKPTSVLVNVARGPLVDTDALVAALTGEHIAGAALDVTDPEPLPSGHPLWSAPNILITPHQADTPDMTAPLLAVRVEHNVRAFLGNGQFIGVVDPVAGY